MIKDKNQLKPGGVKIVLDETTGKLFPTQNDLNEIVLSIHKAGQQAAIHALEETAIEAACTAIEQARRTFPRQGSPAPDRALFGVSACPGRKNRIFGGHGRFQSRFYLFQRREVS